MSKRPFISRKPTKDPHDLPDLDSKFSEKIARDHDAAREAQQERDGADSLNLHEVETVRRLDKESCSAAKGDKVYKQFQDIKFREVGSAFDRHNSERSGSFHGFFALFWLGMAFFAVLTILRHWRDTGHLVSGQLAVMYRLNVWDLAFTDAIMVSSSVFVVALQYLVLYGLSWNKYAWIIENVWQAVFLGAAVHRSYAADWQWIQCVVIILHCLVMLMKQHSYATYMGYLSEIYKARNKLEKKLINLRENRKSTPSVSISPPTPVDGKADDSTWDDHAQEDEEKILLSQIEELAEELTHDGVTYPENLTLWNYIDYLLVPSLVYDIVYPRTPKIRWWYVWEKTLATLGTFGLMTLITEHYLLPVIPKNLASMTTNQKFAELPWLLLDMVFPFITMYLLTFYIIFECITNWFAEVTRFADRNFYNDWWNSTNWDAFARDWNVPVHRFLLRHVYHSSMSVMNVKKGHATFITFLLSSVVHELVMAVMTKKIRFYLLMSQMFQLPLVAIMRMRVFKESPALANSFFWFGLFCGPSFLCLAYVLF